MTMTTLLANTIYFGLAHARALVLYSGGTWTDRDMSKSWKQQLEHGCQHTEAVFFQSQQRSAETGMKLFYVCCDCGHIFT
ncbi:unnamed protein product [Fusarium graminearum]|uniref:DNA-directed RNA polymerase II subunit RPB9 n=1 Tax=Gibberella zeae TaxID=5518 RepID=A0A4E9DGF0_GIBZA|nr:unnamed protein product [Fusarium graminearum]CAF3636850.1 unnamed protein product [Fusarium graminearum]CAG1969567.1 unnamed protein product [Fusarium graminearum]CAG1979768.1 unnamed protein product [Fusarium graminearum]